MIYERVLGELLNTPLLAHPAKAQTVAGVVLQRAGVQVNVAVGAIDRPRPDGSLGAALGPLQEGRLRWEYANSSRQKYGPKPFLFGAGIAVIEVTGSLAHRQWHIGESSGVMGYDGIGAQLDAALADPDVKAIIIDAHSPGGQAHGCFQLADRIAAARGAKPLIGYADEMMFSAAYALGSACEEVWLASDIAECGSVGACMVHWSYERWLRNEGVKPTIFQSGARKTEGHPFADLDRETAERLQAAIDDTGRKFVRRVAQWRGLSEAAVAGLEAATFTGEEAVAVGLADGIAAPREIFLALAEKVGVSLAA